MRFLVDLNVLVAAAQGQGPCGSEGARLLSRMAEGHAIGCVAGHVLTTFAYRVARTRGKKTAMEQVRELLAALEVVPVERHELQAALTSNIDYEDMIQVLCGVKTAADALVTCEPERFAGSPLQVLPPATALQLIRESN